MFIVQVNFVSDIPHVFAKSVVKLSGDFANIQDVTFDAGHTVDNGLGSKRRTSNNSAQGTTTFS